MKCLRSGHTTSLGCLDGTIIHTEKGTEQEVSKVGETWAFSTDKGCELLIHSGEASYAPRDRVSMNCLRSGHTISLACLDGT